MLVTKTGPVGIDWYIQQLQTELHTRLLALWEISNSQYECYGRCYRNKKDNSHIAEVYLGNGQYKEVYWNSALSAISFFGTGSTEDHKKGESLDIHLVFFVDLSKLKPLIVHRADEEVRKDVQLIAMENNYGFQYTSTEIWLENVLREYAGSYRDERLLAVEIQPVHCFRINFEITYNKNICSTSGL